MVDSKSDNPYVWLTAVVCIMSASWSSSTMAELPRVGAAVNSAMQKFDTRSGVASRPSVNSNRTSSGLAPSTSRSISMPFSRGGSGFSMSSHQTRTSSNSRNSRNNYSNNYTNNYRYNSGRNYSSRNSSYYGSRRLSSGTFFTDGFLLGSRLGSYNLYDPYYYGSYSSRYSNSNYNKGYNINRHNNIYRGSYYNNGFSTSSTRYYRSAPVEPTVIYREKIVSDATTRDAKESHMLRGLEGNCFEITYSASGQELRLQVPPEQCEW